MNFQNWRGEIEIFPKDSVMEDEEESVIHIWQPINNEDGVTFIIGEDYELVQIDPDTIDIDRPMWQVRKKK